MGGNPAEERRTLMQMVGECIMGWSTVEWNLTSLYGESVGSPLGPATAWLQASIFDSVVSLDARLDMIGAALDYQSGRHRGHFFSPTPPEHEARWRPVLEAWGPLRNRIR